MRVTTIAIAALGMLLLAAGCDDGTEVADEDEGEETSFNNINGSCVVQPTSCDDLIPAEGEDPAACCFGNQMYICNNGTLLYTECSGGCYGASQEPPYCATAGGGGTDPGGWSEPPTDPGPGF
jgi:hypothetical protein